MLKLRALALGIKNMNWIEEASKIFVFALTLYLLVQSADNFCKQLGSSLDPDKARTKCRA